MLLINIRGSEYKWLLRARYEIVLLKFMRG
jgi:hypothetical protein